MSNLTEHRPYLYRWDDLSSGKWYIGSRTKKGCHPNDGYISHSKVINPMIAKNKNNWKRTVLCVGGTKYIIDLEHRYLTLLNARNNPMSYNQHNGDGNWTTAGKTLGPQSKNARLKKSIALQGILRGPQTVKHKEKQRAAMIGKNTYSRTEETKQKMSLAKKNKPLSEEHKNNLSIAMKNKPWSEARRAAQNRRGK